MSVYAGTEFRVHNQIVNNEGMPWYSRVSTGLDSRPRTRESDNSLSHAIIPTTHTRKLSVRWKARTANLVALKVKPTGTGVYSSALSTAHVTDTFAASHQIDDPVNPLFHQSGAFVANVRAVVVVAEGD
jgi:hypothetical protein